MMVGFCSLLSGIPFLLFKFCTDCFRNKCKFALDSILITLGFVNSIFLTLILVFHSKAYRVTQNFCLLNLQENLYPNFHPAQLKPFLSTCLSDNSDQLVSHASLEKEYGDLQALQNELKNYIDLDDYPGNYDLLNQFIVTLEIHK